MSSIDAMAELHAPHRTPFAPENAGHVVLRAGHAEGPKEFSRPILKLVARANGVEHRLLPGRLERLLFPQFLSEGFASHGLTLGDEGQRVEG
jgi:hypothetical protein